MATAPSLGALLNAARTQAVALARLPGTALEAAEELRDAARTMRRVADRIDGVLDDVEEPARTLAPALARLSRLLDDPMVAEAPETLRRVRDEVLPALRTLRDTQQRVATIAGSTERITALIDETGGRLAALPTAAALLMRRGASAARPPAGPVVPTAPAVPAGPVVPVTPPPAGGRTSEPAPPDRLDARLEPGAGPEVVEEHRDVPPHRPQ